MLEQLRSNIDSIDKELIENLCNRFDKVERAAMYKIKAGLAIYHPNRETNILNHIAVKTKETPYSTEIQELYQCLFQLSRRIQFQKVLPSNIVLIGFMGSGKSTIGKMLSEITGFRYYDIDQIISTTTKHSVADIFRFQGEAAFRVLERQAIIDLASVSGGIIACGGGTVLSRDNVADLKKLGKIIWLKSKPKTIFERLRHNQERFLLTDCELSNIEKLLQERYEIYHSAADFEVDNENIPLENICQEIIKILL